MQGSLLGGILDRWRGGEGSKNRKKVIRNLFRRRAFRKGCLALKVGINRASSRRAGLAESNLSSQHVQVFFESFRFDIRLQLQGTQSFQDVMCQRAAVGGILKKAALPATITNDDIVQFLQPIDQLLLLLFQHLDISTLRISSGSRPNLHALVTHPFG